MGMRGDDDTPAARLNRRIGWQFRPGGGSTDNRSPPPVGGFRMPMLPRPSHPADAPQGDAGPIDRPIDWPLMAAALVCALPPLLAYNQAPSPTLMNQCLAMGAWGGFVVALAPSWRWRSVWSLQAALAALAVAVVWSWSQSLPSSLALSSLAMLAAAMVMVWAGASAAGRDDRVGVFVAFAWGLLAAGLGSVVVALVQVFAPGWTDGTLIAHSGLVGRAVGNLRQPNHLCSLLLWAVIAAIGLHEVKRLPTRAVVPIVVALVFAVELSASRTGAAALALLAAWGLLDRRLSRPARALLLATPVVYALSYGAMSLWGEWTHQAIGAEARLAAGGAESPNSRGRIWANAWALTMQQPWTGVGFGEFNLAWSLTPFPGRPTAFFDHTHSLPIQLAVELGLPLTALVLGLLALALWQGLARSARTPGAAGIAATAAWGMAALIGVHSLVEYPLWYAYFLLPAAFAFGLSLGAPGQGPWAHRAGKSEPPAAEPEGSGGAEPLAQEAAPHRPPPVLAGALAGALMIGGAAYAMADYLAVVAIYAPGDSAGPLSERIRQGQRSPFFAYQADYAAATTPESGADVPLAFRRAPHFLMDTRLMMAWAQHLDATGRSDAARALVERIREFRNADSDEFLAECETRPAAFQCQPARQAHPWREYLGGR